MPSSSSRSSSGHRSRDGVSRRSRSSGRSRSRHREVRHSRSQSRFRFKHKERNFPAAICSMITIVILCVAMAEPKWFYLSGGGCKVNTTGEKVGRTQHSLGIAEFFYAGSLSIKKTDWLYTYSPGEVFINCVDRKTVLLMKTVIAFCFITVMFSLLAFLLDLIGPSGRVLMRFHRNAIFSIITVTLCVVINIFCYLISAEVSILQTNTKQHKGSKVVVSFDISFYLIAAAGSMSVFAVACNCFRRYPLYDSSAYNRIEEEDDIESIIPDHDMSAMSSLPPPPAYTPRPNQPQGAVPPTSDGTNRLPSYTESVTASQAMSNTPSPSPAGSSQMLSVNA